MPAAVPTQGTATVDSLAVALGALNPLLTLNAQVVQSSAAISGTCGSGLTATGSTLITGGSLGGILVGKGLVDHPAPNTIALNLAGVLVVLNEQSVSGDGKSSKSISVSAIHISLQNSLLSGLGLLTGDIVIGQSDASVQCPATPPPSANLVLTGSDSPDPVTTGARLTYSFAVSNHGPDTATAAVFSNTLPSGLGSIAASSSQGSCSSGSPVVCTLGNLASGQSVSISVSGVVTAAAGRLVDTATVTSGVTDPDGSNNSLTLETAMLGGGNQDPAADLGVAVTPDSSTVHMGEVVRCTVTIANQGPDAAPDVVLSGPLPQRAEIASVQASQGGCSTNGAVSCALGSLAPGKQATVKMVLAPVAPGVVTCAATVTSGLKDPDPSDNSGEASVEVVGTPTGTVDSCACRIDAAPAATLLFPYFEVDMDHAGGATTLISVNNASPVPHYAQVTLWSDWGIPTLSFTLALGPRDVQSINLRDVLRGALPASQCAGQSGSLTEAATRHIQAWHTGHPSPTQGTCASPVRTGNVATGYVTVDAVTRCSTSNPTEAGYFIAGGRGIASDDNVLWGDYILVDTDQKLAHGDPAVHIQAEPDTFRNHYSFYGSFVGGSGADDRQPLGTRYSSRFLSGGLFQGGTQLIIWRDAKVAHPAAVPCGTEPARMELSGLMYDEDGKSVGIPSSKQMAPWSTQKMSFGPGTFASPYPFGWVNLDLWHKGSPLFGDVAQGWVTTVLNAQQRFSVAFRAIRLDSACDF
jgi:uncharacterized repeat protein (TIGR01451 family)